MGIPQPKHSTAVLSSTFLNARRMYITEKYMLDKCDSGMSYGTIGCEFNVDKPTIYII